MGRRKILFVNHRESRTGAPKIVYEIAKAMRGEFDVRMLSLAKGSMSKEFCETFGRVIYPETDSKDAAAIQSVIAGVNPDLVYVNCMAAHRYAEASKKLHIPTIYHIHELEKSVKYCLDESEVAKFNRVADIYIACSNKVREFLVGELGCLPEKTRLVYSFISANEILLKSREPLAPLVAAELERVGKPIIAGMGSADRKIQIRGKGVDIFVKACRLLKHENLGFIWIGPYDNALLREVCGGFEDLEDRLSFLGLLENPFPCLRAADIFVLPSRQDAFPLAALESMALGKPSVVFADGGGSPEAIGNYCGVVVHEMSAAALADSIAGLAADERLMLKFAKSGPGRQKTCYDSEVIIPQIKSLVRGILQV